MKCVEQKDKPFNYQEWAGPHIEKLIYSKTAIFRRSGLRYTRIMEPQRLRIVALERAEYEMINGYKIYGSVFSDPKDNSSGTPIPETNVIIMAHPGVKGAIVVLPTGEVHSVSSKSWKPSIAHFKV